MREAMAVELKGRTIGGPGKVAEIDGGYFGGYLKPANLKENRIDRRRVRNQNGKRKAVVIIRERDGNSLPAVFRRRSHSSRRGLRRAQQFTRTNQWRGTTCIAATK